MKNFFIILSFLFLIALIVIILTGNITWKNAKDKSVTVKESFLKTYKTINETAIKIKKTVVEKIQEIKESLEEKTSETEL